MTQVPKPRVGTRHTHRQGHLGCIVGEPAECPVRWTTRIYRELGSSHYANFTANEIDFTIQ